jgi:predicted enzyme related to lactoylglutathione lyase/effector-binding domain-containing protein
MGEKKLEKSQIGAPTAYYWTFSEEKVVVMIGFLLEMKIAESLTAENGYSKFAVGGGKFIKSVLTGPYDLLPKAWAAIFAHLEKTGQSKGEVSGLGFECYMNDPSTVKPEELRTEIFVMVSDKRKREPIGHGGVCHLDIGYENKERAQKFYSEMFGWTFIDWKGDYFMFHAPSGIDGGFEKKKPNGLLPSLLPYINVDKINKALFDKIVSLGGKIVGEPILLDGHGGYQAIVDSEGNHYSVYSKDVVTQQK